jgi:hypothetical protein
VEAHVEAVQQKVFGFCQSILFQSHAAECDIQTTKRW